MFRVRLLCELRRLHLLLGDDVFGTGGLKRLICLEYIILADLRYVEPAKDHGITADDIPDAMPPVRPTTRILSDDEGYAQHSVSHLA